MSNAAWWQDFPASSRGSARANGSEFARPGAACTGHWRGRDADLVSVVARGGVPRVRFHASPQREGIGSVPGRLRPGRRSATAGRERERERETAPRAGKDALPGTFRGAPIGQFSSVGSFTEQWLVDEFGASLRAGAARQKKTARGSTDDDRRLPAAIPSILTSSPSSPLVRAAVPARLSHRGGGARVAAGVRLATHGASRGRRNLTPPHTSCRRDDIRVAAPGGMGNPEEQKTIRAGCGSSTAPVRPRARGAAHKDLRAVRADAHGRGGCHAGVGVSRVAQPVRRGLGQVREERNAAQRAVVRARRVAGAGAGGPDDKKTTLLRCRRRSGRPRVRRPRFRPRGFFAWRARVEARGRGARTGRGRRRASRTRGCAVHVPPRVRGARGGRERKKKRRRLPEEMSRRPRRSPTSSSRLCQRPAVPPRRYGPADAPWTVDTVHAEPDCFGRTWPPPAL